jgi:hypothetical protein
MFLEIEPVRHVSLPALVARRKQIHQSIAAAAVRASSTVEAATISRQTPGDLPNNAPACPPTATTDGSASEISITTESPDPHMPYRPTIRRILSLVAQFHGLSTADLMSTQRTRRLTIPRQIAMALARELTPHSLAAIGKRIGGRDHTTVLHAILRVRHLAATDPKIASSIADLRQRLERSPEAMPLATLVARDPVCRLACPPGPDRLGHSLTIRNAPRHLPRPIIPSGSPSHDPKDLSDDRSPRAKDDKALPDRCHRA